MKQRKNKRSPLQRKIDEMKTMSPERLEHEIKTLQKTHDQRMWEIKQLEIEIKEAEKLKQAETRYKQISMRHWQPMKKTMELTKTQWIKEHSRKPNY